jgi:curli biogenesis system outer membrane secretion channel CsgG
MQSVRFRSVLCLCLLGIISLSGCSNISVAVGPRVTQADLRKIKKVAIQLDGGGFAGMPAFGGLRMMGGGGSEAFSDHFAVELLRLGIDVVERAQLDKVMKEQALNLGGVTEAEKTIAVGKILAVDALITGSVGMGQTFSSGYVMGIGAGMQEIVNNASIKIIDVEKGNWLLIITMSGGKDSVLDTATAFAKALKQKIDGS